MAYTPISTMFNTPYSTTTVLSPLTPLSVTPVSPLSPLSVAKMSPFSTISTISPISPVSPLSPMYPLSPFSTVSQSVNYNNNTMTVVTPIGPRIITTGPRYMIDIDTGIEDNYIVQRDITRYFMYKSLDKWLYTEWDFLLKYLVVEKNGVRVVKNETEKDKNDISKDSDDDVEDKVDYIGDHILTENAMKEILMRIMRELGLKIYNLPHREGLVMDVIEKYLKKKLRKRMDGTDKKSDD